jgi:hypothetical protein
VLVLSGTKCGLGVSIDNCDIVLLLNNTMSIDRIQQMMYRSMTEGNNKKCGFVIDLNIQRNIEVSIDYALSIKPNMHPKEAIKYLLNEKIINLNCDHWMPCFGNNNSKINTICDNVYDIYSSQLNNVLDNTLKRINLKMDLFSKGSYELFNTIFKNVKLSKENSKELCDKIEKELTKDIIKKGIEKKVIENNGDNENDNTDMSLDSLSELNHEDNKIKPFDILKPVSILISLLTIEDENTTNLNDMNILIENNINKKIILINQIKTWWGKNIENEQIESLIKIFVNYMEKDKEASQLIRTIKELFCKNINNGKELSKVIDKYLIPQEHEKKSNAEVSTQFNLRKDMLDTVSVDFWKSIKKVFEPCVGKGGFILDIIDRFMIGLKETFPDEKLRYKTVVEECLYFSDINPTNIFICKLLIDPYNKYKLNYHEGDTLKVDIKEKWNIDIFDAVIGNPPYNEDPENSKDPHMKPLYQDWIYKFNELSNMLLFITPSKWFSSDDKPLVELRNYMKKCNIEFIHHNPRDDVFKNVKIKGGVSYFMINKNFKGKTLFNDVVIDINKYDILVEPKYYNLLTKIQSFNDINLSEIYCSQGTFLNSKTEKEINDNKNDILCYVSKKKGLKKYISPEKITKKYNYWKVITPAASYKGTSGFSDIYVLNEHEIHSRSYISFRVKNETEAKSLFSYLKCKLIHVLLSLRKQTHNLCNSNNFIWIPIVPLNKEWTNDELYKHFKLDNKDIEFIKNLELDGSYIK